MLSLFLRSLWPKLRFFLLSPFEVLASLFYREPAALQAPKDDVEHLADGPVHEQKNDTPASSVPAQISQNPPASRPRVVTRIHISGEIARRPDFKPPELKPGEMIYIAQGELLSMGGTAFVEMLPSGAVIKVPIPDIYHPREEEDHRQNMRLEAKIYKMIGEHPRVPKLLDWDPETCCLTMEYLENGNLREYIKQNQQEIPLRRRLQWSRQAAEGLALLHAADVIHCDLSPRNFLLDADLNLKISDFAGASICGSEPSATPATRFLPPGYDYNIPPVFGDDLFSLGSLIFFIMTNSYPYEEVTSDEVEKLYEAREFPNVSDLVCGTIIQQCWHRQVDTAVGVFDCLAAIEKESVH